MRLCVCVCDLKGVAAVKLAAVLLGISERSRNELEADMDKGQSGHVYTASSAPPYPRRVATRENVVAEWWASPTASLAASYVVWGLVRPENTIALTPAVSPPPN